MIRRCGDISFARDDQRLGDQRPDVVRCLACARNVHALENRGIPHHVWSLAVRELPDKFAFIEIDGRNRSIRRLISGNPSTSGE